MTTSLAACHEPGLDVGPGEIDDDDGKADAAIDRAELKLTIDPSDLGRARSRFSLLDADSQTRRIWFFDTASLALYERGTILRAREIDGEDDDSTVKLRPFERAQLAPALRALDDVKCELDRSPESASMACSLKVDQIEGTIAAVGRGERAIEGLFSPEQHTMFAAHGPAVAWDHLARLGPIAARVWTLRSDEVPAKVTAELWSMPDGTQTLEVSMKVDLADAAAGMAALRAFVDARGLGLAKQQESKTRRALESFAAASAP